MTNDTVFGNSSDSNSDTVLMRTKLNDMNVRDSPSLDGQVIGRLKSDEIVKFEAQSVHEKGIIFLSFCFYYYQYSIFIIQLNGA